MRRPHLARLAAPAACVAVLVLALRPVATSPAAPAVQAQVSASVALAAGWNAVSLPVVPVEREPARVFASVAASIEIVYAWDAATQAWLHWSPLLPPSANNLDAVDETMGLWVQARAPGTLPLAGTRPVFTELQLTSGWNFVGWPGSARSAAEAWGCLQNDVRAVYGFEDGSWQAWSPGAPLAAARQMRPGAAYWVHMQNAAQALVGSLNAAEAAEAILRQVTVAGSARVAALACPLPAGSLVSPLLPEDGEGAVSVAAPSYFAWIDDRPGHKYRHPTRLALLDGRGTVRTAPSSWWPRLGTASPPALLQAVDAPAINAAGRTVHLARFGSVAPRPLVGDPLVPLTPLSASPATAALAEPRKVAVLIDGGEADIPWWAGGDNADEMEEDADDMGEALEKRGFAVNRISQKAGRKGSYLYTSELAKVQLRNFICGLGLTPGDSFMLYVNAHGNMLGFGVFDKEGSGHYVRIDWAELARILRDCIPISVDVTVMLDVCHSGAAIPLLSRPGGTVMTATDSDHETPAGDAGNETFTEEFLDSNFDDDTGVTFQQAFEHAKKKLGGDSGNYRPQWEQRPHPAQHCAVKIDPEWRVEAYSNRLGVKISVSIVEPSGDILRDIRVRLTAKKPGGELSITEFVTPAGRPAEGTVTVTQPGRLEVTFDPISGCGGWPATGIFDVGPCPHGELICPGPPPVIM